MMHPIKFVTVGNRSFWIVRITETRHMACTSHRNAKLCIGRPSLMFLYSPEELKKLFEGSNKQ